MSASAEADSARLISRGSRLSGAGATGVPGGGGGGSGGTSSVRFSPPPGTFFKLAGRINGEMIAKQPRELGTFPRPKLCPRTGSASFTPRLHARARETVPRLPPATPLRGRAHPINWLSYNHPFFRQPRLMYMANSRLGAAGSKIPNCPPNFRALKFIGSYRREWGFRSVGALFWIFRIWRSLRDGS